MNGKVRALAALLAAVTLWSALGLAGDVDAAAPGALLRQALVGRELGLDGCPEGTSLPGRLVLRQSPVLLSLAGAAAGEKTPSADSEAPAVPPAAAPGDIDPGAIGEELVYADNGVPAQTVIPAHPAGYTVVRGVYIKNSSGKALDAAALEQGGFAAKRQEAAPQVLIIHTHGSEAYSPPPGQSYVSTGKYRTSDTSQSVVRVGDEIAAVLSAYGLSVVHDRTLYDDPLYDGAYQRSAEGIAGYLEKYPSLTYVLDIHRDAVEDAKGNQYKLITKEDPHCAQISFIMGSNNDHWQENLKLAIAAAAQISALSPTAMRPITLRSSNYNQHLTTGSLLVEVGTAGNSLEEAITAGRLFARGLAQAIAEEK